MKYATVSGLVYGDPTNRSVACTVTFDALGAVPFMACAEDPEDHGREIFARALAGDFGPVAPYVEPEPLPAEPSVSASFAGKTITVTAKVARILTDAAYEAVALGDTALTVTIDGVSLTGTLSQARTAVKAFKAL